MEKIIEDKIYEFLKSLSTEIDVLYHVDIDEIDLDDPYESICSMIEYDNGFDSEIIYYSDAINYLKENDPSLQESLYIASEYGYEAHNLNSEVLASLLSSKNIREEFYELENEITEFFDQIKNEIELLKEEEI